VADQIERIELPAHLLLQGLKQRNALQELTNRPPSAPQGDTLPPSLENSVVFNVNRQRSTSS
jgi:hypothetical protein